MQSELKDFFRYLNQNCVYLVLRNWEDIFKGSIYCKGHEDIDILCDDLGKFVSITGAKPIHSESRRDNYIIQYKNINVRIDVRWVGDGYYPSEMSQHLLTNRVFTEEEIYVPSTENYYYSLAYHAILQKPYLSEEYKVKLNQTRNQIMAGNNSLSEKELIEELLFFIKKNKLFVEYPSDPGVYLNEKNLAFFPMKKSYERKLRRKLLLFKLGLKNYINMLRCQK